MRKPRSVPAAKQPESWLKERWRRAGGGERDRARSSLGLGLVVEAGASEKKEMAEASSEMTEGDWCGGSESVKSETDGWSVSVKSDKDGWEEEEGGWGLDMWEGIREVEKLLGFGEGRGGQEEVEEERVVVMREGTVGFGGGEGWGIG